MQLYQKPDFAKPFASLVQRRALNEGNSRLPVPNNYVTMRPIYIVLVMPFYCGTNGESQYPFIPGSGGNHHEQL